MARSHLLFTILGTVGVASVLAACAGGNFEPVDLLESQKKFLADVENKARAQSGTQPVPAETAKIYEGELTEAFKAQGYFEGSNLNAQLRNEFLGASASILAAPLVNAANQPIQSRLVLNLMLQNNPQIREIFVDSILDQPTALEFQGKEVAGAMEPGDLLTAYVKLSADANDPLKKGAQLYVLFKRDTGQVNGVESNQQEQLGLIFEREGNGPDQSGAIQYKLVYVSTNLQPNSIETAKKMVAAGALPPHIAAAKGGAVDPAQQNPSGTPQPPPAGQVPAPGSGPTGAVSGTAPAQPGAGKTPSTPEQRAQARAQARPKSAVSTNPAPKVRTRAEEARARVEARRAFQTEQPGQPAAPRAGFKGPVPSGATATGTEKKPVTAGANREENSSESTGERIWRKVKTGLTVPNIFWTPAPQRKPEQAGAEKKEQQEVPSSPYTGDYP